MRCAQVWRARMVREAVPDEAGTEYRVGGQGLEMPRHSSAVPGHQEVLAGREEVLRVAPGRADEGDSAGERLENPDGGNAGQGVHVEAAGDVHGGEVAAKACGTSVFGSQPW